METLRIALPSKGELEKPTLDFLKLCGLSVNRPSERQYTASISSLKDVSVIFQRTADILSKVDENSVDLGITGYDIVRENLGEDSDVLVIYDNLGYGQCNLVIAVPDSWLDVSSLDDLAEVTAELRQRGGELRIATKYPNLTQQFLYQRGIRYFGLVGSSGALEAAPELGYADLIVDITSSGTTLRENHLKRIVGGTILSSYACLIANHQALARSPEKMQKTRTILEHIEAHRRSTKYLIVTANLQGDSESIVTKQLNAHSKEFTFRNLSAIKLFPALEGSLNSYSVSVMVKEENLMNAIDYLRGAGGREVMVMEPQYVFESESNAYKALVARLKSKTE